MTLIDDDNNNVSRTRTNPNGYYELEVDRSHNYRVRFTKPGFETEELFSAKNQETHQLDVALSPEAVIPNDTTNTDGAPIVDGQIVDIGKVLNIIIYFDLDKAVVKQKYYAELEKLVVAMTAYPHLKVEIRSHTDSRANDNYNLRLSDRRAKATLDYLVSRGIAKSRLSAKGFGETQLVNGCSNGVKCSDADHYKNRRSEFIIIER